MTPKLRGLCAFLWATFVLLVENPWLLLALFGITAVFALWHASSKMVFAALLVVCLTTWSTLISQGLFYGGPTGEVWLRIPWPAAWGGAFPFYREGALHGLLQSLRFSTTSLLALGWVVASQRQTTLDAPVFQSGLGLMVAFGLRHLPALARDLRLGWRTARLVGEHPLRSSLSQGGIFLPLLGLVLRRAHRLAEGLFGRDVLSVDLPRPTAPKPTFLPCLTVLLLGMLVAVFLLLQSVLWLAGQGFALPQWLQQAGVRWL